MVEIPLSEKVLPRELRALLSSVHWTHAQLAARIGMGKANVTRWANGKFDPAAAFHIAVRCLGWHQSPNSDILVTLEKKKPGRPLGSQPGFDLTKSKCPQPDCKRGNRQMRAERDPYDHAILGKVLPVFCDGTHAFKHPRVTLRLDRKGWLWNISKWPTRRKLAPFERRRVQQALVMHDAPDHPERLLQAFARCRIALNGIPGCGSLLKYQGHAQSSNAQRRRLHVFQCSSGGCRQQWDLRYFDASGKEVARTPVGGARRAKTVLPRKARLCRVCETELVFEKRVSQAGGIEYDPPLYRLRCPNPRKVEHRTPARPRAGTMFNYDPRRSQWVTVDLKALKKRGPKFSVCRTHGRMRRNAFTDSRPVRRVPKAVFERLGSKYPIYRDYCACHEIWLSAEGQKHVRRPLPRYTPQRTVF